MYKTKLGDVSKDAGERAAGENINKIWWAELLSSAELLILCVFLDNLTFFIWEQIWQDMLLLFSV